MFGNPRAGRPPGPRNAARSPVACGGPTMPNDLGLVEAMLDPTLTVGECEEAVAKAAPAETMPAGDGVRPPVPDQDGPGTGVPGTRGVNPSPDRLAAGIG